MTLQHLPMQRIIFLKKLIWSRSSSVPWILYNPGSRCSVKYLSCRCVTCICIINVLPNALLKAGSGIYCIGRLKGRVLFMFCGVILNSSPFLRRQLSCWCPFTVKFKCCVKSPVLQNSCVNILYTFWDKSFIFFNILIGVASSVKVRP